jgi:hypothetical protein
MRLRYFLLAVFIWFVTSYPSIHLRAIYDWHHHALGVQGLRPELVDAYIWKATWLTACLSILSPSFIWALEKIILHKTKLNFSEPLVIGPITGVFASAVMYSQLNPAFLAIAKVQVDDGGFLYSGLLSGVITGELCRRSFLSLTQTRPPSEILNRRFWISALMTWAVLLKMLESLYLSTLAPGRNPVGIHLFMLASVLLWTPLVCKMLWKHCPSTFFSCVLWCIGGGVLLPPLASVILLFPAVIMLYAGITPSVYGMIWGALFLKMTTPGGAIIMSIAPGLSWGLVVGTLLWRYSRLQLRL